MTSWPQEKEKNTLPKTSSLLLIIGRNPEGKDESPNHQFSRGNSLLVSGRVRCSIGNTSTCKTCPVPSFFDNWIWWVCGLFQVDGKLAATAGISRYIHGTFKIFFSGSDPSRTVFSHVHPEKKLVRCQATVEEGPLCFSNS